MITDFGLRRTGQVSGLFLWSLGRSRNTRAVAAPNCWCAAVVRRDEQPAHDKRCCAPQRRSGLSETCVRPIAPWPGRLASGNSGRLRLPSHCFGDKPGRRSPTCNVHDREHSSQACTIHPHAMCCRRRSPQRLVDDTRSMDSINRRSAVRERRDEQIRRYFCWHEPLYGASSVALELSAIKVVCRPMRAASNGLMTSRKSYVQATADQSTAWGGVNVYQVLCGA
jgi:hypothetical protein